MELSTAVKPVVIRYLFETDHFSRVLYFDPDILLLSLLAEWRRVSKIMISF